MSLNISPRHDFPLGFIKGNSAVRIHRQILGNKGLNGLDLWSRGYWVSTVGLDEETIKKYIGNQGILEKCQGALEFDKQMMALVTFLSSGALRGSF